MYFKTSDNNYLEEIWDTICTISNIKHSVTDPSLNFPTQKSEKTPFVLHLFDLSSISILQ